MRILLPSLLFMSLTGCSSLTPSQESTSTHPPTECKGSVALPTNIAANFEAIEDQALLESALGEPEQGKLCQGQVYESRQTAEVVIFRAWNSTNPNSQFGQWWAFDKPNGKVSAYRSNYEICYQWSPLDKLVRCTLKPGTKVVVGNGQSAKCSEYLTYDVSETQQIYISDAANLVTNCSEYDAMLSWQ
ncbi:hypothetical protein K6Y31_17875 [Motilimonas cestriensis]|uniref:Lipoprotein n=1 Tax=Motilimonas cestriensis TaxID=2742685 RepID=A0ABS8WH10_9GAMM|nr:hypothetical protein [Motilimonas cestriensis]MCE2596660.1 hypothetical protein [Motilimonas cestriensis]